jgi:hypothetical protein
VSSGKAWLGQIRPMWDRLGHIRPCSESLDKEIHVISVM